MNFQIIIYVFICVVLFYSLILWVKEIKRKRIIRRLGKKYPYGFIYNGDNFLSDQSQKELPVLNEEDKKLFRAIGISNFAFYESSKINWSDFDCISYYGD